MLLEHTCSIDILTARGFGIRSSMAILDLLGWKVAKYDANRGKYMSVCVSLKLFCFFWLVHGNNKAYQAMMRLCFGLGATSECL